MRPGYGLRRAPPPTQPDAMLAEQTMYAGVSS